MVTEPDPFELLGVPRTATIDEISSARRRLALRMHPDVGGDEAQMQQLNAAFEAAVEASGALAPWSGSPVGSAATPPTRSRSPHLHPRPRRGVQHDAPSFTIDALPAEAFEALLVVASWIGDVLVDDPPYLLEAVLGDPVACWCRLDLVPDAGASTVSLAVAALDGQEAPLVDDVRDLWVTELNRLGA